MASRKIEKSVQLSDEARNVDITSLMLDTDMALMSIDRLRPFIDSIKSGPDRLAILSHDLEMMCDSASRILELQSRLASGEDSIRKEAVDLLSPVLSSIQETVQSCFNTLLPYTRTSFRRHLFKDGRRKWRAKKSSDLELIQGVQATLNATALSLKSAVRETTEANTQNAVDGVGRSWPTVIRDQPLNSLYRHSLPETTLNANATSSQTGIRRTVEPRTLDTIDEVTRPFNKTEPYEGTLNSWSRRAPSTQRLGTVSHSSMSDLTCASYNIHSMGPHMPIVNDIYRRPRRNQVSTL
jgi:hypothetical protein